MSMYAEKIEQCYDSCKTYMASFLAYLIGLLLAQLCMFSISEMVQGLTKKQKS